MLTLLPISFINQILLTAMMLFTLSFTDSTVALAEEDNNSTNALIFREAFQKWQTNLGMDILDILPANIAEMDYTQLMAYIQSRADFVIVIGSEAGRRRQAGQLTDLEDSFTKNLADAVSNYLGMGTLADDDFTDIIGSKIQSNMFWKGAGATLGLTTALGSMLHLSGHTEAGLIIGGSIGLLGTVHSLFSFFDSENYTFKIETRRTFLNRLTKNGLRFADENEPQRFLTPYIQGLGSEELRFVNDPRLLFTELKKARLFLRQVAKTLEQDGKTKQAQLYYGFANAIPKPSLKLRLLKDADELIKITKILEEVRAKAKETAKNLGIDKDSRFLFDEILVANHQPIILDQLAKTSHRPLTIPLSAGNETHQWALPLIAQVLGEKEFSELVELLEINHSELQFSFDINYVSTPSPAVPETLGRALVGISTKITPASGTHYRESPTERTIAESHSFEFITRTVDIASNVTNQAVKEAMMTEIREALRKFEKAIVDSSTVVTGVRVGTQDHSDCEAKLTNDSEVTPSQNLRDQAIKQ